MNTIISGQQKRLRYIFSVAAFTAACIILCQLYWVYFNYQTAKANFVQSTTMVLRQSIDSCLLGQNTLPPSLSGKNPSLTIMTTQQANQDSTYSVRLATVNVNEDQLPGVKALVARLFSLRDSTPVSLDTLSKVFHEELLRIGVTESFAITLNREQHAVTPGQIAALIHVGGAPAVVSAELNNPNAFLLRMNLVPALISTFLIALSAFSLLYMGRIIKRQMQLDNMKTDFVNNIVHELRTPLTILRSSNEAMAGFGAAHDEASLMRYLGINTLVIDDLDQNIDRILDFSKVEQGKRLPVLETIDLLPVLQQVELRFSQVKHASIHVITDENNFEVVTDRFMLGVILSNLVDNAIKYSPQEAKIRIAIQRGAQHWQLQISDEGMGIEPSALPYIFDKFYRVPTGDVHEIKGYGLGLAYVKQLVVDLKGKIEVASEVGKGTIFTLTFYDHGKH